MSETTASVLGIDPGASTGALAIVQSGRLLEVVDMPHEWRKAGKRRAAHVDRSRVAELIAEWQERYRPLVAAVEQVGAMPKQGVTSTFNFGLGYGVVLGVLAGRGIEATLYRPAVWKRAMGLSRSKAHSLHRASTLWLDKAVYFRRKKDDGRAEAALLAWYHDAIWHRGMVPSLDVPRAHI